MRNAWLVSIASFAVTACGGSSHPAADSCADHSPAGWSVLPPSPIVPPPEPVSFFPAPAGYILDQHLVILTATQMALYDPVADRWGPLPLTPNRGAGERLYATPDEQIIVEAQGEVSKLDEAAQQWVPLPGERAFVGKGVVELWTGARLIEWGQLVNLSSGRYPLYQFNPIGSMVRP